MCVTNPGRQPFFAGGSLEQGPFKMPLMMTFAESWRKSPSSHLPNLLASMQQVRAMKPQATVSCSPLHTSKTRLSNLHLPVASPLCVLFGPHGSHQLKSSWLFITWTTIMPSPWQQITPPSLQRMPSSLVLRITSKLPHLPLVRLWVLPASPEHQITLSSG